MSVALASAVVACEPGSSTRVYTGIGSMQASGESSMVLAHQTVSITSCGTFLVHGRYVEYAVVRLGPRCAISGEWDGATFRGQTGDDCTLPMPDPGVALHVSDAVVRRPVYGVRFAPAGGDAFVNVQIGGIATDGDDAGRYVVYRLSGSLAVTVDATRFCEGWLARAPNSPERGELEP